MSRGFFAFSIGILIAPAMVRRVIHKILCTLLALRTHRPVISPYESNDLSRVFWVMYGLLTHRAVLPHL
jgi:hypothetical protein